MSQSVCILGLGLSGVVAARHALAAGDDVTIYAGASSEKTRAAAQEFSAQGVSVIFDDEQVAGHYDLCVACPGIPQTGAFYQNALAASDELISEPEYAWRFSPENWIAVTGTNGKTTTTTLIAHLLNECGKDAVLCGNTQKVTITEAAEQRAAGTAIVAELSSFQLASTRAFAPRIAVLLNITSDHIAWHGSQEAYAQAKLDIFKNLQEGSTAVITDSVPAAVELVATLRSRGVRVLTVGERRMIDCTFADEAGIMWYVDAEGSQLRIGSVNELKIKGTHNVENALAAAAAAIDYGCSVASVAHALTTFAPLSHRIEPCGSVNDVSFYNDSKATNVDATLKALTAFAGRKVVLLVGGRDKGTDLSELVIACERACKAVVCYGEGGQRFYDAFAASGLPRVLASHMRDAFSRACELAEPGDVVLLSPACASFDEFTGFVQRGDVFKELVSGYRAKTAG